ncbi:MAG TPA: SRPBCC domain-containing protein [Cytophaga sp.]|jgi:uncharacterized protein YndB with AHSA1/START domain|nr:SRPBCC domain-containing protein [Cytophaga sp.]
MKHNLSYDFSVDKENKKIKIKREFAANQDLVWDAFTKKEILGQWWAPKPWKVKTKSMDFKSGGQWLYAMVGPDGEEHWSLVEYIHVEPVKHFTGKDAFTDSDGNINKDMPRSKWEVTFTGKAEHTIVDFQISYDDLAQLEATIAMGFKEGITMTMEVLDELLISLKK